MDHASFLGLRALGRGPVIECTWVFTEPVDLEALEVLNRQLALGFLGRRIQRSPLPWGRPRWVVAPVPEPVILLLQREADQVARFHRTLILHLLALQTFHHHLESIPEELAPQLQAQTLPEQLQLHLEE